MKRILVLLCVLWIGCSTAPVSQAPVPQVHVGNVVQLGGSPGEVRLTAVAHPSSGPALQAVNASVPAFPWQGQTSVVVPLLQFGSIKSWTLTFQSSSEKRTVEVVALPASGHPGDATLAYLDQLTQAEEALAAPQDPGLAKLFPRFSADAQKAASEGRALIAEAQAAAVQIGSMNGQPLMLDAAALAAIDSLVTGAGEPVVTLSGSAGTAKEALTNAQALAIAALTPIAVGAATGVIVASIPVIATLSFAAFTAGTAAFLFFEIYEVAIAGATDPSVQSAQGATRWVDTDLKDALNDVTPAVSGGPLAAYAMIASANNQLLCAEVACTPSGGGTGGAGGTGAGGTGGAGLQGGAGGAGAGAQGGAGGQGGAGSNACCACTFDVYCTVFGPGGCWECHNSVISGGVCQAPSGYLTSPGVCVCDPALYQVCQ